MEYNSFERYLSADEYVLWQGKPSSKPTFSGRDIFIMLFSIFWCGMCFTLYFQAIRTLNIQLILFGLPFAAVGCYLLFGRFIYDNIRRKNTSYILTNKKIIRLYKQNTETISLNNLPPMNTQLYKNGNGNIYFNIGSTYNGRRYRTVYFTLENIPDCAKVEQLILSNMDTYYN